MPPIMGEEKIYTPILHGTAKKYTGIRKILNYYFLLLRAHY